MGVKDSSTANSASIQQYEDNGSRDHLWQFVPGPGGWWKIKNLNSGLFLAVQNASTANSAQLQQYEENGTDDHLWRVEAKGAGLFFIRNKNSQKLVGVDRMATTNGANIIQFEDNGTRDQLWTLLPAVSEGCSAVEPVPSSATQIRPVLLALVCFCVIFSVFVILYSSCN